MNAVSLFSGCLGLDRGLEDLGIGAACYVENDRDCLRLIRERRPGALIVEDVAAVDEALAAVLGDVDLVAGGFPCQDLSYAGSGVGLSGERSGLWFEMARVIRVIRPRLILVENVPGLLTRGLGVIVHELASSGYVGRWFTCAAADVGAPHRRERVFVIGRRADEGVRVEALTGPNPSGLYDAAGWLPPQETLFGAAEPLPRLGKRGRWTLDRIWEDDSRLALDDDSDETLLPTPNAYESTPTPEFVDEVRAAGIQPDERLYLPGRKWHAQRTLSRVAPLVGEVGGAKLLPTPVASEAPGAEGETRKARQETGATGGPSLRDLDAVAKELPRLLPTPQAADGDGGRQEKGAFGDGSPGKRPSGAKANLPIARGELPREFDSWDEVPGRHGGTPPPAGSTWGVYEAAIRRWEETLGRDAPAPTDEKGRLSPEFVEWMMGFDDGWTSLDGVSRTARLRMLGNAVHVQVGRRVGQALLALDRELAP